MKRSFLLAIGFALLALIPYSCKERPSGYQFLSGEVWTTDFNITYNSNLNLQDSIIGVLDSVGKSLSVFDEESLVSKVNNASSCRVNQYFIDVYNMSREIHSRSRRRFDPTLTPLITAWGFGAGHQATQDTARIDDILKYVGIEKTRLSNDTLYKQDARIAFNFSGIAKGYGCDRIAAMFQRNGVSDYLIEIGGEIALGGVNEKGEKWTIAVEKPAAPDSTTLHEVQLTIEATDCGIATSGNYRNYHGEGKNKYGHTIDPSTGRPVQTDVISATIIAPSAMEADAMATACMTMDSHSAIALCDSLNYPAMLILADFSTVYSSGFRDYLK